MIAVVGTFAALAVSSKSPDPAAIATTQAHADELTEQLARTVRYRLPDERLSSVSPRTRPLAFFSLGETSEDGYQAAAVLNDAEGASTLTVFVRSTDKHTECVLVLDCQVPLKSAGQPEIEETSIIGTTGSTINLTTTSIDGKVKMLSARSTFPDGTTVSAVLRAQITTGDLGNGIEIKPSRSEVPVTADQFVAMVDRPGFHY
ncbi:hypothetical protein ABZX92_12700 [Lentzea sp. NPDC006480]|uniref:hypothetical protein n=1 Tax=Lentzea sp. NPDC006480 TaxID=3157176 RepID=UPI0033B1E64A